MAQIRIVGNKSINCSEDKARRILAKWRDENIERSSVVDLGLENFVQLGQIKGIDFQNIETDSADSLKRREEKIQQMRDWNDYVSRCKAQSVEEKAKRMVKTFCALLWTVRGGRPTMEIPTEIYDELMIRLLDFFDKNPQEWHADQKVYDDLIPFNKVAVATSNVKGMKSIGEIMSNPPSEKSNIQRATCDICQKPFEYEGTRPLFCPHCEKDAESGDINLEIAG